MKKGAHNDQTIRIVISSLW